MSGRRDPEITKFGDFRSCAGGQGPPTVGGIVGGCAVTVTRERGSVEVLITPLEQGHREPADIADEILDGGARQSEQLQGTLFVQPGESPAG